jgi:hypothetical protein
MFFGLNIFLWTRLLTVELFGLHIFETLYGFGYAASEGLNTGL